MLVEMLQDKAERYQLGVEPAGALAGHHLLPGGFLVVYIYVVRIVDEDILCGQEYLQFLILGECLAFPHVCLEPSEIEYHTGTDQGGRYPHIDTSFPENRVVDFLRKSIPDRYRRILVLEGPMYLKDDAILGDRVYAGQEIGIRHIISIHDYDLVCAIAYIFQCVRDGFMLHAMVEVGRKQLDR